MADWFYAKGQQQFGPISEEHIRSLAASGAVLPGDLVWSPDMPDWVPARQVPQILPPGVPVAPPQVPLPDPNVASTKLAAGLCGILLGSFGVHKFVLGMTTPGVIMLVITLAAGIPTCGISALVMHVIGLAEGIIYLLKPDQEFYETYMIRKKEWF